MPSRYNKRAHRNSDQTSRRPIIMSSISRLEMADGFIRHYAPVLVLFKCFAEIQPSNRNLDTGMFRRQLLEYARRNYTRAHGRDTAGSRNFDGNRL